MNIYQLIPVIAYGDAVGNDTIAIEQVIKRMGYGTRIFAETIVPPYDKKTAGLVKDMPPVKENDIIIYHLSTGSQLNFDVADYKCRKIIMYHNITPPNFFESNDAYFRDICEWGLRGAKYLSDKVDYCLTVSEFNKQDLIEMGYKCDIDVLPIIIPFEDYRKKPDKTVIKEYRDGYTNILFTGRIAPNKKHEDLLAAFYYYKKLYNPKSRLILAGSFNPADSYYRRLVEYSSRLGFRGKDIVFTGHIKFNQILSYYSLADVFLCMSEHEGFCVPLVEAMMFDVPVVAYASTAIPGTLGGAGFLMDKKDPVFAAACIDRVVKDRELRKNIVEKQQKRLHDFEYEVVAQKFEKYLTKFINNIK